MWSDAPDGHEGCLAVVAVAAGKKTLLPTYGLDFKGLIPRPYKEHYNIAFYTSTHANPA